MLRKSPPLRFTFSFCLVLLRRSSYLNKFWGKPTSAFGGLLPYPCTIIAAPQSSCALYLPQYFQRT